MKYLVFMCFLPLFAFQTPLFPVVHNGSWGYIDTTGALVLQPFRNGAAVVHTRKGFGLINRLGEWLTEPEFTDIEPFDGTFFHVTNYRTINDSTEIYTEGVIDASGKWIAPMNLYKKISPFCRYYARVELVIKNKQKHLSGLIDKQGQLVISIEKNDSVHSVASDACVCDGVFRVLIGKETDTLNTNLTIGVAMVIKYSILKRRHIGHSHRHFIKVVLKLKCVSKWLQVNKMKKIKTIITPVFLVKP